MKAFCLAVDVVNADKPTASLAFLAGVCEHVDVEYKCASINVEMLRILDRQQFQSLYESIKLGTEDRWLPEIDPAINDLVNNIKQFNPDVLLVSFFSFMQLNLGKYFLNQVRKSMPDLEIVAGGPGIYTKTTTGKTNGSVLCAQGFIDYYVLGEGDELLPAFLLGERELLGLNSRDTKFESWVPQINDLDKKYILPSYKKIDFSLYHNLEAKQNGVVTITTSRGCVRACTFCDISKSWPKFKFRSGISVANEIVKHWIDTGISNFYISDSLINGSLKTFKEFNQAMIQLKQQHPGLENFSYNGMFIVRNRTSHNEEFFAGMAAAGCESIAIGVETGSDRLRAEMDKKFTLDDLDWHMTMCQKYKIRNVLLTFVAHPKETADDFQLTLDLLDRYQKYIIDETIIGINHSGVYELIHGTPDWDHRDATGIVLTNDERINWINVNNPSLTIKERILRDLAFRKHAAQLRYSMPYTQRYVQYLKNVNPAFIPMSD